MWTRLRAHCLCAGAYVGRAVSAVIWAVATATNPPRVSAWGGSRCCCTTPHSLQKIKQTNEKFTPLLPRDAPELLPPLPTRSTGADGEASGAYLVSWHRDRQDPRGVGGKQAAVGWVLM